MKKRKNKGRKQVNSNQNTLTDIAPAPLAFGQLTDGISLTKLTHCYTVFPNYGTLRGGKTYIYVRDKNGKNILSNESENKIYDTDSSQLMNMLLSQVVDYGTASKVKLKELIDVAGKTGTSSGDLDRLFIGYTPYYTGGVWIGGKNKRVGIDISYPIHLNVWDDVMSEIHNRLVFEKYGDDIDSFETDMLVQCEYCKDSGMLCSEICFIDERGERSEIGYFKRNCKPTQICDRHTIISNINSDRVAVIHDRVQSEYYTTLDAEYIVDKNREK